MTVNAALAPRRHDDSRRHDQHRIAGGIPRALRIDAADPYVRDPRMQTPVLERRGRGHRAPVRRAGGGRRRCVLGVWARRLLAGTYRGHGHALAKGHRPPDALDRRALGRQDRHVRRAGRLHERDGPPSAASIGCFRDRWWQPSPAATGAALAPSARVGWRSPCSATAPTNQGYFHECLNFARVLGLPAVLVCENRGYWEFTPMGGGSPSAVDLGARARAYGIPSDSRSTATMCGRVREAGRAGVERARAGRGPMFIEVRPTTSAGTRSDPGRSRPTRGARCGGWRATRSRSPAGI